MCMGLTADMYIFDTFHYNNSKIFSLPEQPSRKQMETQEAAVLKYRTCLQAKQYTFNVFNSNGGKLQSKTNHRQLFKVLYGLMVLKNGVFIFMLICHMHLDILTNYNSTYLTRIRPYMLIFKREGKASKFIF